MSRRSLLLVVLVVLLGTAVAGYYFLNADGGLLAGSSGPYEPLLDARDSLLSQPRAVGLALEVDIPKGSEPDNPEHQEISAEGLVDFSKRDAELVYDFQGLANAAGFLGHFDTMEVRYAEGTAYLDVFTSGPPWVRAQPEDVSNDQVQRLRDIMLTTPVALPALMEVAAHSEPADRGEASRVIEVSDLAGSTDELLRAIGEALEGLQADTVTVEVTFADGAPSSVVSTFSYEDLAGRTDMRATYELSAAEEEVFVQAPDESDVREMSSIFDTPKS